VSDRDGLSKQDPTPPKELAIAMRNAVENKENPTAVEILEAAERLLDKVLRTDCETRATALHLLTVDALMTQALHVANEDSDVLADFAEQAMRRVGSAWR
jgi:UTP:GlnB (protein PII) uridylyltransferase